MKTEKRVSSQDFKVQWFSYIAGLNGLKWNLEESDREKLNTLMLELDDLVNAAADSRIKEVA